MKTTVLSYISLRDVVCYIFALFHALSFVVSLQENDNWLLSELLQVLSREMTPSVPEVEAKNGNTKTKKVKSSVEPVRPRKELGEPQQEKGGLQQKQQGGP